MNHELPNTRIATSGTSAASERGPQRDGGSASSGDASPARSRQRDGGLAPARRRASAGVSRPVNVFCWLGWNEHSSVEPAGGGDLDAVTEARPGADAEQRAGHVVAERTEAHDHAQACQQRELALEERAAGVALVGRRGVARRRAAHRRRHPRAVEAQAVVDRDTDVGWLAKPARCIEANRKSPERSPVNTRPVRLPRAPPGPGRGRAPPPAGHRSPAPAGPSTPGRGTRPACPGRPARARRPAAGRPGRRRSPSRQCRQCVRLSHSTAPTLGSTRRAWPPRKPLPRPPPSCCSCATARRRPPVPCCPAGRPACTSPTRAREQAERVAERIAELKTRRRDLRLARWSGPGRRRRRSPRPAA